MFVRSWRLLGASLLFGLLGISACGGGNGGGPDGGGSDSSALGEQVMLAGQISGWNRGAQTLRVGIAGKVDMIKSAPIDAAGNFSVSLPSGALLSALYTQLDYSSGSAPGCQGAVKATPTMYNAAYLALTVAMGSQTLNVVQSVRTLLTQTTTVYVYVDRQVDQTGTSTCPMLGTWNFDLHYKPGWNRIVDVVDPSMGFPVLNRSTGPTPAGAVWEVQ